MNLEQVFLEWPNWHQGQVKLINRLGGLSNQSYLVETESEKFVVRLNKNSSNLGVSRDREQKILWSIKGLPFSPEICFWNSDYLVTKYIRPSTKMTLKPKSIANLFREIHRVEYSDLIAMNPSEHLTHYYKQIDSPSQKLENCYTTLVDQNLRSDPKKFCLCHHDLLPENVIQSYGGFTIIDWEYAQYGDPIFDLAIYTESMDLDKYQTKLFIEAYGKEVDIKSLEKFRLVYALINILWWNIKKPQKDISLELFKLENKIHLSGA